MEREPVLVVPIEPRQGKKCPIADSAACVQYCPLWSICESEGSPWACEDEDIPDDDSDH